MSIVERIWEQLGLLFGAIGTLFSRLLTRFIGTDNLRQLRRLEDKVAAINALEKGPQGEANEFLRYNFLLPAAEGRDSAACAPA